MRPTSSSPGGEAPGLTLGQESNSTSTLAPSRCAAARTTVRKALATRPPLADDPTQVALGDGDVNLGHVARLVDSDATLRPGSSARDLARYSATSVARVRSLTNRPHRPQALTGSDVGSGGATGSGTWKTSGASAPVVWASHAPLTSSSLRTRSEG